MNRVTAMFLGVAALIALLSPRPALAGEGRIHDGVVDLTVYFAYHETDIAGWQKLFNDTNGPLFRATNGLLRFGTIRFTEDAAAKDTADILISGDQNGRAHVMFKNLQTLGRRGAYTQLYGKGKTQPFTLLHELGHYLFVLRDEYRGRKWEWNTRWVPIKNDRGSVWFDYTGRPSLNPWFCTTTAADNETHACIMDSSDNWKPGRVNFCLDGKFDDAHVASRRDGNTFYRNTQQELGNAGCWKLVAQTLGAPVPTAPPNNSGIPSGGAAFTTATGRVIAIVVQRNLPQADLTAALQGARAAIDAAAPDTDLTVYAYDSDATQAFGFHDMSAANKTAAKAAIDGIVHSGTAANLDASLLTVNAAIGGREDGLANPYAARTIVLFGDGTGGGGTDGALLPSTVRSLQTRLTRVDAVPTSEGQTAVLENLSTATLGQVHAQGITAAAAGSAQAAPSLTDDAFEAVNDATGRTELAEATDHLAAGQTVSHAFSVDGYVASIDVVLEKSPQGTLGLTAPDGTAIDLTHPPSNITVTDTADHTEVFVSGPQQGSWTATVSSAVVTSATLVVSAIETADAPVVEIIFDQDDTAWPHAIGVHVVVEHGGGVPDATVTATVTRPDGSTRSLTLYDDGSGVHGDRLAGDGEYSAYFPDFVGNGPYVFDVTVRSAGGTSSTIAFDSEPGNDDGGAVVLPFQRRVMESANVHGAPTTAVTALAPGGDIDQTTDRTTAITITWSDPNQGQASWIVQRSTDDATWTQLAAVPPGATSYTDATVSPTSAFFYRVIATAPGKGNALPSESTEVTMADIVAASAAATPFASPNATVATSVPSANGGSGGGGGGCFIATAAYGSYLDPHVMVLRRFRDNVLLTNAPGQALVAFYYRTSPPIADWIAERAWARLGVRLALTPVVLVLEFPIVAGLLAVTLAVWLRRRRQRLAKAA